MFSLLQAKLLSAVIIFVLTLIAGYYPFYKRYQSLHDNEFPLAEGFACGVFLGAGLIHMLGDAAQQFEQADAHYPWAFLIAGMVFLLLYFLEEAGRYYQRHQTSEHIVFAVLATVMLSIHSLLEGAALGLSGGFLMAGLIFIAIIAHKWAAGFALAIHINKSPLHLSKRAGLFLWFALMTPLGIWLGNSIHTDLSNNLWLEPILSAMAAGTFIYLGTVHGLRHRTVATAHRLFLHLLLVASGFSLMAIVALWT